MMKYFLSGILLFLVHGLMAQVSNQALDARKIVLDSKDGHAGKQVWVMKQAGEISANAEEIS